MRYKISPKVTTYITTTGDYTLMGADKVIVATNSFIKLTLPPNPPHMAHIKINFIYSDCNILVDGNGKNIRDMTGLRVKSIVEPNYELELIYVQSLGYWIPSWALWNESYSELAAGWNYTLGIRGSDKTLWAWGNNAYGQLGNNSTTSYSSPISVWGGNSYTKISATYYSSLALRIDGTAWAWGYNNYGNLGNNTRTSYSSPISVAGERSYTQIAMTGANGFALSGADGTIWSWGDNTYGQLGNNASLTTSYSTPVQVVGTNSYTKLADTCGNNTWIGHFGAIKSDGTLWMWGNNNIGQLGNNSTTSYSSPIQIGTTTYSQITVASSSTLAIKSSDGTIWSWGLNSSGQLGDGTRTNHSIPTSIGNVSYTQVKCCGSHTLAIKGLNGSCWAWGLNDSGQLGNNTVTSYSTPQSVLGNISYNKICCGAYFSLGTKGGDGSLWAWGLNSSGQLGNNTMITYSSPI